MSEKYYTHALAQKVIAVAVVNTIYGDWSAYIDAVPGIMHKNEFMEVVNLGEKLPEKIAVILFPHVAKKFRWRD